MSLEQPDIYFVLTQFRGSYPSGALLTELLQIHQDKFLVRATVQVDGVPLATGMASAAVLELAEDQARIRALGVLGIYPLPKVPTHQRSSLPFPTPPGSEPTFETFEEWAPPPKPINSVLGESDSPPSLELATFSPPLDLPTDRTHRHTNGNHHPLEPLQAPLGKSQRSTPKPKAKPAPLNDSDADQVSATKMGAYSFGTVSREQPEESLPLAVTEVKASGPIDLSDIIAQTSIEVARLGWTPDQGKQYLKQAYGKESRQLLTPDELISFLSYLKSEQPTV